MAIPIEALQAKIEKQAVVTVTLSFNYSGAYWDVEMKTIDQRSVRAENRRWGPLLMAAIKELEELEEKSRPQSAPQFEYGVRTHIVLTAQDLTELLTRSAIHYDRACREAGQPGGFLHGWQMGLLHGRLATYADFAQLDLCSKILENPATLVDSPGTPDLRPRLMAYRQAICTELGRLAGATP